MITNSLFLNILASALSFVTVLVAVPPILRVARAKKLFDIPDVRKIHKNETPSLGGIAIFLGFIVSVTFFTGDINFARLRYIILGIILMLIIGLKDDLIGISARKKFSFQFLAASMIILLGDVRLTNLHGLFGVYEVNAIIGGVLTLIVLLTLVNAFNLIDGIDGLAAGLAMLASAAFGTWFLLAESVTYAVVSFALLGSLGGFFLYNVFGHKNKLFMGDTGSLFVGLIIAILVVKFNEFNVAGTRSYVLNSAPVISFAVVMVPLIDVLRVMTIRLLNGNSPFKADRNHIHHRLLELVPRHLSVTLIIIAANVFLIALALFFNFMAFNITMQFLGIFFTGITLSFIPSFLNRKAEKNRATRINPTELQTWPD
jgi:UDP-GlcNAc:undecaprenyl-phosphate/decaprenyl-phosphate GlcNAc-1-phosphate transferase